MAAYEPAINRIRYLAGLTDTQQKTPSTISGGPRDIYSYRLMIASKTADGTWNVLPDGVSSVTTNRHIRAAAMALPVNERTEKLY